MKVNEKCISFQSFFNGLFLNRMSIFVIHKVARKSRSIVTIFIYLSNSTFQNLINTELSNSSCKKKLLLIWKSFLLKVINSNHPLFLFGLAKLWVRKKILNKQKLSGTTKKRSKNLQFVLVTWLKLFFLKALEVFFSISKEVFQLNV